MLRNVIRAGLLMCAPVLAQAPVEFEVATVKPTAEPPRVPVPLPLEVSFARNLDSEQVRYRDVTLKMLLAWAYDVKLDQVEGPGWIGDGRFEVQAKVPGRTSEDQVRRMLQALLAERFHVQVHREEKRTPVYELVVAKGGAKLKPPSDLPSPDRTREEIRNSLRSTVEGMQRRMEAHVADGDLRRWNSFGQTRGTMAQLIANLARNLDRPIVDKTQVEGLHDFYLEWVRDETQPRGNAPPGPTIFAALEEQLGLSLREVNADYGRLIVDAAERLPDAN